MTTKFSLHPMALRVLVDFTPVPNASTKRGHYTPESSRNRGILNFPLISREELFVFFSWFFVQKLTDFCDFSQFFPIFRDQLGGGRRSFFWPPPASFIFPKSLTVSASRLRLPTPDGYGSFLIDSMIAIKSLSLLSDGAFSWMCQLQMYVLNVYRK